MHHAKYDTHLYEEVELEEINPEEVDLEGSDLEEDELADAGEPAGFTGDGASFDEPVPVDDRITVDERRGPALHRDLAALEPTRVLAGPWGDVEVVNRTKNDLSPYTPIYKRENYAEASGNLTGYSVEVADPASPTGFRHLGNVSAGYLLLSNLEVHEVAMEVAARSGLAHRPSRVFWDGGRYMEVVEFEGVEAEVEAGDPVRLCLVLKNSYNKAWPLEVTLAAVRAVCENGMIAGTHFARVRFKHVESNLGGRTLSEVVGEAVRVLESAEVDLRAFVDGLKQLKRMPATHEAMRDVRERVLTPRVFGSQKWGDVMDRFYRAEESTLFGVMNAATYATWHGRVTAADVEQNEAAVTGLLAYAAEHRN